MNYQYHADKLKNCIDTLEQRLIWCAAWNIHEEQEIEDKATGAKFRESGVR